MHLFIIEPKPNKIVDAITKWGCRQVGHFVIHFTRPLNVSFVLALDKFDAMVTRLICI
jgi:hypothetical protein